MGLKQGAEAHKYGGLVGRAGPNVQGKVEEKGHKGSVLLGEVACTVGDSGREGRVKSE